ncbi:DinB family protein [Streptomyces sp. NPDC059862]|uniref:DinB family protein n=1 Tax=Streptomyces sp. NPDC059862 TaxID=3346975 RepID=UPI0036537783
MTACMECGFEYDLALAPKVSALVKSHADAYADLLRAEPSVLRRRSAPHVWAPLEYACHMRDVLLAQRERVLAARRCDTPVAEPMGRDERVEHDGYAHQQPTDVARQLQDAALLFTNVLDRLSPADWERALIYTYPEREERSLRWLAVHTLHELRHHLLDIRRQLEHHDGDRCDSAGAPSASAQ